jgi:hypothetical protein
MLETLNRWGGVVGLIALFATVPVGILINIATPRLEQWWARTSRTRLERRIKQLTGRIEFLTDFSDENRREVYAQLIRFGAVTMLSMFSALYNADLVFFCLTRPCRSRFLASGVSREKRWMLHLIFKRHWPPWRCFLPSLECLFATNSPSDTATCYLLVPERN